MRNEKVICAKCPFPEKCGIKILRIDKQWDRSRAFAAMWSHVQRYMDTNRDLKNHFDARRPCNNALFKHLMLVKN